MSVIVKIEVKTKAKSLLIFGGVLLAVWSGVAHGSELMEIIQLLAKRGKG